MHPTKKFNRRYLRVNSVGRLPSDETYHKEMKPLSYHRVDLMKELDLKVRMCDMGNACYIDKHYSDII